MPITGRSAVRQPLGFYFLIAMRPNWLGSDKQAAAGRGRIEVKFYVEPKMPIVRNGGYRNVIWYLIAASSDLSRSGAASACRRLGQLVDYAVSDRHTADRRGPPAAGLRSNNRPASAFTLSSSVKHLTVSENGQQAECRQLPNVVVSAFARKF